MKYYLLYDRLVMRGDDNNVVSFETFRDGEWKEATYLGWQLLYGDLIDFKEITEEQALEIINNKLEKKEMAENVVS